MINLIKQNPLWDQLKIFSDHTFDEEIEEKTIKIILDELLFK